MSDDEHALLDVGTNGPRKDEAFDIPTGGDHGRRRVGVVHRCHVLCDDRTFVEIGRHIVRGRADELHASFPGLVVWPPTLESREE